MAYMTVDFSGEFEKIIRYFEDEMSKIEVRVFVKKKVKQKGSKKVSTFSTYKQ